jgi:hypothetical protein
MAGLEWIKHVGRVTREGERVNNQSKIIKRIEQICIEFDARVEVVGLAIARLELAKALAEAEERKNADNQ